MRKVDMEYNISKFDIKFVKEKYDKNDVDTDIKKDNCKAVITRYFKNGGSITDEYAVVDNKKLYKKIKKEEELNLENCYIKNFSLRELDKNNNQSTENKIEIKKINAKNSFWHGELTDFSSAKYIDDIDFSHSVFYCKRVNFSNSKFSGKKINFINVIYHNTQAIFENSTFNNERILFPRSEFGEIVSFADSIIKNGNFNMENSNFFGKNNFFDGMTF